jgi:hypothetical protein
MRPVLLLAVLIPAGLRAEDTHPLKIRIDVGANRTVTDRDTSTGTASMRAYDRDGKLVGERKFEGSECGSRTTVLEVDKDGRATRYLRTYDKATEKADGKTRTLSYQGRTVLFEKKDGRFRLGVVGDPPLDDEDVERLVRLANGRSETAAIFRNLAPARPVEVGDTWTVSVKPVIEAAEELTIDESTAEVSAKLVKVYPKGPSRFGTIEVTRRYRVTALDMLGLKLKFDPPASFECQTTWDLAIDGSSVERKGRSKVSLKGEGRVTAGGTERRIVLEAAGTDTDDRSAEVYDAKALAVPKMTYPPRPGEWAEFKPKDGLFLVKFPGRPKESSTKGDGYVSTQWTTELDEGLIAYSVAVINYADPTQVDAKATLEATIEAIKSVKSRKDIEVNGFPGADIVYEVESGGSKLDACRRIVMVNGRGFQVAAVAVKGKTADVDRFFKSFQLLGAPLEKGK